jgi:shikimate dehydrogenase
MCFLIQKPFLTQSASFLRIKQIALYQLSLMTLISKKMNNKFIMAGVMGWPVAHSRSPLIHNHWIREHHLNGAYGLFPVNPNELHTAIRGLKALGLAGCNITIPHKVNAMTLVDWVQPLAQRMGAINTIVVQPDGSLHGFNNDGFGFMQSLITAKPTWKANDDPIVVIGAGGAARGILVSLIDAGASNIRLINRTYSKAEELAKSFGGTVTCINWDDREEALPGASLLVNTTNQGMHGETALDLKLHKLPTTALVFDAIYIPIETPLLSQARLRGNPTVNGLGMLLHQARPAFHAWFGVMPEVTDKLFKEVMSTI